MSNSIGAKPYSAACERNCEPILAVLRRHFADRRHVLEIGSGTAQHAVHFAAALPHLIWQCSDAPENLPGIRAWLDEASLTNTPPPWAMQATTRPRPAIAPLPILPAQADGTRGFDAVFSANTLHIMCWEEVEALFAGLREVLTREAIVAIYGPFNYAGAYTSASNREFDRQLRARGTGSAIRDIERVDALAREAELVLIEDVAMPANNRTLVWRRGG